MLSRLFYSDPTKTLELDARKSDDPLKINKTVEFFKSKKTTEADIKAFAWLAKVITLGSKSYLYNQKHVLREEEGVKKMGGQPGKSNSLACCFFLAMMLRDAKLDILENSGWIKSWNSVMQDLFNRINKKQRPLQFDGSDGDINRLLEIAKRDIKLYKDFFTYCFDQRILGGGYAADLAIKYEPKDTPKRDEHDGLLAKSNMGYS